MVTNLVKVVDLRGKVYEGFLGPPAAGSKRLREEEEEPRPQSAPQPLVPYSLTRAELTAMDKEACDQMQIPKTKPKELDKVYEYMESQREYVQKLQQQLRDLHEREGQWMEKQRQWTLQQRELADRELALLEEVSTSQQSAERVGLQSKNRLLQIQLDAQGKELQRAKDRVLTLAADKRALQTVLGQAGDHMCEACWVQWEEQGGSSF